MDYKSIILKFAFTNGKLNKSFTCKLSKNRDKYCCIINYIMSYYDNKSKNIREALYRLFYNINEIPKCPVCDSDLSFVGKNGKLYLSHCSNKCKKLDNLVQEKFIKTCLSRYDTVTNRKKAQETCITKYGVKNPFQIDEVKSKIQLNNDKLFETGKIQQKMKETCNKRYNVDWYVKSNDFEEKRIETSFKKYNTKYPIQADIVKSKYNWDIITKKIYNTKKEHNSFNISKSEDEIYLLLKEKYPDIIRQYNEPRYPFNCDFYVPSKDLFIEYQGSWTHGSKPFEGTLNDLLQLQNWCEKNTGYYDNAIDTWCIRDVRKRKIAKQNKLNYIELWNLNDINR